MIYIKRADISMNREVKPIYGPGHYGDWGRPTKIVSSAWTGLRVDLEIEFNQEEATKHVVGLLQDSLRAVLARGKRVDGD